MCMEGGLGITYPKIASNLDIPLAPLLLYKKACVAKCCTYADFARSLFLQLPALMCKGKMANVAHPQDVVVLCLRNKRTGLDKNEALG